MSDSTIGIMIIEPKTATSSKSPPSGPQGRERERESAALTSEAVTRQAPPPPGMGKLVDKTA